jgi:hypothetical protein
MRDAFAARQEREFNFADVTRGGRTLNPVTLVTPTVLRPAARLSHDEEERSAVDAVEPLGSRNISAQSLQQGRERWKIS